MIPRSPSGRYVDWDAIIQRAKAQPGRWVIRYNDVSVRLVRRVNARSHPALRMEGGRLEAKAINQYVDEHGVRKGDVYIRYTPDAGGALP